MLTGARRASRQPFSRRDEDFEIVVSIEESQPGTALDALLRREQALAILELVASTRGFRERRGAA